MSIHGYYPEMGEAKPVAQMEVQYAYGGLGWYVYTPLTLETNRSIRYDGTYTAKDLVPGSHKVGWNIYRVTNRGLDILKQQYAISMEILLD